MIQLLWVAPLLTFEKIRLEIMKSQWTFVMNTRKNESIQSESFTFVIELQAFDRIRLEVKSRRTLGPWSLGSWTQCLSPLKLWVRISIMARCKTLCDKICRWLATGGWFSRGPPVSSTNKTDRHDIAEILLKVALNTIKTNKQTDKLLSWIHLKTNQSNQPALLLWFNCYNTFRS